MRNARITRQQALTVLRMSGYLHASQILSSNETFDLVLDSGAKLYVDSDGYRIGGYAYDGKDVAIYVDRLCELAVKQF